MGIASLAKESWAQLGRYLNDHGIMEVDRFSMASSGDDWLGTVCAVSRDPPGTVCLGYFSWHPWVARLVVQSTIVSGQNLPRVLGRRGYPSHACWHWRARTRRRCYMWYMLDLYFVELAQWRKSLGGMEASLLIPILCIILYGYEVSLPLSGVVDEDLYVTLALAI